MKSNDSFVHNLWSDFHMTQRTLAPVRFSDGLTGHSIIQGVPTSAALKRESHHELALDSCGASRNFHPGRVIIPWSAFWSPAGRFMEPCSHACHAVRQDANQSI